MRSLTPGVTYPVPFSTSTAPDELPTATVYAGATLLGAATVTAASGTNEYSVAVAMPGSGLTDGTPIYVKINWAVGGEAQSTVTLLAGIVGLHQVQAAAVLTAAAATPIAADVRRVNGEVQSVATEESVQGVLGAVGTMSAEAVRVPSPNVRGNLNLVSGDTYDGIANAKPSWIVAADYTDGWSVALTIRSKNDEVVLAAAGEVESAALVSVGLVGPVGLEFEGCPGVWQGKYDVQLSKGSSRKTIAVGACYVTEDQTR